jgi:hypothetical protein
MASVVGKFLSQQHANFRCSLISDDSYVITDTVMDLILNLSGQPEEATSKINHFRPFVDFLPDHRVVTH